MKPKRIRRLAVALVGLLPTLGLAQLSWRVVPGEWNGSVELGYDRSSQASESATSSSSATRQTLREAVRLSNSNFYVLDPRLMTGSLGVQLNLSQSHSSGSSASLGGADTARMIGYDFNANFLKYKPYFGSVYANRSQIKLNQAFGGTVEGTREARGFSMELKEDSILQDWGVPWFRAVLNARQENSQYTTTYFDRVTRQDQSQRTLDFTAQKGFTTADLTFRYFSLNDTQNTGINYSLDFGPGLNRRFDSTFSYATRSGANASNTLDLTEALQLRHSRNLATGYNYSINRQQADDKVSLQQAARATLSHELYTNLSSVVTVDATRLEVSDGSAATAGAQFSQAYRHSLPGMGALGLNWSGGYSLSSNDFGVGIIHVTAEKHNAPDVDVFGLGIGFFLEKANAVAGSVQVTNVQSGSPVPVSQAAYNVVTIGDRIRIEPVFGNTEILPKDRLEVSYDYLLDPKLKYETRNAGFGASVNYGWIGASYQHQQSSQHLLEGQGLYVNSTRSDSIGVTLRAVVLKFPSSLAYQHTVSTQTPLSGDELLGSSAVTDSVAINVDGQVFDVRTNGRALHTRSTKTELMDVVREIKTELELHGVWHQFDGLASAVFEEYRGNVLAYQRRALNSSLVWQVGYTMTVVASLGANDMQYYSSKLSDVTRTARGTVSWRTEYGWNHDAFAGLRFHDDGRAEAETILQIGGRTRWSIGKLSLAGGASYDRWVRGQSRSNGLRFDVSAIRSF